MSEAAKTEEKKKGRGAHALGRFIVVLIIIAFLGVNAWTFIDMFQFSLLVASVDVSAEKMIMFEQESSTLSAEVRSFGLSETLGLSKPEVLWSSSDESIASVDENGTVTATSSGTATITAAESKSGVTSTCSVRVYSLTDVMLSEEKCTLGAGDTFAVEAVVSSNEYAEPFEYTSSDESVATVDADGVITAIAPGEAVITVSARGYTPAECAVSSFAAPTMLMINDSGVICLEETRQLDLVVGECEYNSSFVCSSSDAGVIDIDASGRMKAVGEGTATITARTYNGVTCSMDYTVTEQPKSVQLGTGKMTVYSGFETQLMPTDSTGVCREYTYSSSDPAIVEVDENGVVVGHNQGSASVTCTSYNGKTASVTVNVRIVNYKVPYNSARVYQNIEALQSTFPELITTEIIGQSVMGKDIPLVKLGKGERKAVIVAGLHSRENIGITFTMRSIEEYAEAYYSRKGYYGSYNIREMLDRFTLYIVPMMNPDGLDIATMGDNPLYTTEEIVHEKFKNNANGVNLNRNFPLLWGYSGPKGTVNTTTPDTDSYAGASEASEPETQAIMKLCAENEFEWLLDMHCRGNMIYYVDVVSPLTEADNAFASRLDRKCGFTLTDASNEYEISGGLENWFRREYGRPGICVELVLSNYAYNVNEKFEVKTVWDKTRYTFLVGMID